MSGKINLVKKSMMKFLTEKITDVFIYNDSAIDISKVYKCVSTTNLPLGTEVTFILKDSEYGVALTGQDLKNKFIIYENVCKRIINYVSATGQVTIESGFGVPITTTSDLTVQVNRSIFVDMYNFGNLRSGRLNAQNDTVRFFFTIKTKLDSNKDIIFDIIEAIKDKIYAERMMIDIFNDSNVKIGNLVVKSNVDFAEDVNSDKNIQIYTVSFLAEYMVKY